MTKGRNDTRHWVSTQFLIHIFLRCAKPEKYSLCEAKPYSEDVKNIFDEKTVGMYRNVNIRPMWTRVYGVISTGFKIVF